MSENDIIASLEAAYDEIASQPGHDLPPPENPVSPPQADIDAKESRTRDDQGRFATKDSNAVVNPDAPTEAPASVEAAGVKPPEAGKAPEKDAEQAEKDPNSDNPDRSVAPPRRVGRAIKAAWNELPEVIRQEIWEREDKMDRGMARYSGLGPFADQAEANGRTLGEVMAAYTAAEERLMSDPIATIADFCKMTNTNPLMVAKVLGVPMGYPSPEYAQSPQQGALPVTADPRVDELIRWKEEQAQREQSRETQRIFGEVEGFLSDTKRFPYAENVRGKMSLLFQNNLATSLEDAYEKAVYLDPTVRQLVEEEKFKARLSSVQQQQSAQNARAVVQQAKQSAGSVTGSPMAGGRSTAGQSGPKSVADTLREAYDSLAG